MIIRKKICSHGYNSSIYIILKINCIVINVHVMGKGISQKLQQLMILEYATNGVFQIFLTKSN